MPSWTFPLAIANLTPIVTHNGAPATLSGFSNPGAGVVTWDVRDGTSGLIVGQYSLDGTNSGRLISQVKDTTGASNTFGHQLQVTLPDSHDLAALDEVGRVLLPSTAATRFYPYNFQSAEPRASYRAAPRDLCVPGFQYNGMFYVLDSTEPTTSTKAGELAVMFFQHIGGNHVATFVRSLPRNVGYDDVGFNIPVAANGTDYFSIRAATDLQTIYNFMLYNSPPVSYPKRWTEFEWEPWVGNSYTGPTSTQWGILAGKLAGKIDGVVIRAAQPFSAIPAAFQAHGIKCYYYMSGLPALRFNNGVAYPTSTASEESGAGNLDNGTLGSTTVSTAITNLSASAVVASATGVFKGMYAIHASLPSGTKVQAISGTSVTFSNNATATNAAASIKFASGDFLYDSEGNRIETDCQGWQMVDARGSGPGTAHDTLMDIGKAAISAGYDGLCFDHSWTFYTGIDGFVGGNSPGATQSWQQARMQFVLDLRVAIQAINVNALIQGNGNWGLMSSAVYDFNIKESNYGSYLQTDINPMACAQSTPKHDGEFYDYAGNLETWFQSSGRFCPTNMIDGHKNQSPLITRTVFRNWYQAPSDAYYIEPLDLNAMSDDATVYDTTLFANAELLKSLVDYGATSVYGTDIIRTSNPSTNKTDTSTPIINRGRSVISARSPLTLTLNTNAPVVKLGDPINGSAHTVNTVGTALLSGARSNAGVTISGGSLTASIVSGGGSYRTAFADVGGSGVVASSRFHWEGRLNSPSGAPQNLTFGFGNTGTSSATNAWLGQGNDSCALVGGGAGGIFINGVNRKAWANALVDNHWYSVDLDINNGECWFRDITANSYYNGDVNCDPSKPGTGVNLIGYSIFSAAIIPGASLLANGDSVTYAFAQPSMTLTSIPPNYGTLDQTVFNIDADGLYIVAERNKLVISGWAHSGYGFAYINPSYWLEGDFHFWDSPTGGTAGGTTTLLPIFIEEGPIQSGRFKSADAYFTQYRLQTHFTGSTPTGWRLFQADGMTPVNALQTPFPASGYIDISAIATVTRWTDYVLKIYW